MSSTSLLDTYIENSAKLIEVTPDDTRVSITYHAKKPKSFTSKKPDSTTKIGYSFIKFKTFNPITGTCYKFKTSKSKDLSRVLAALGPKGVQFTKTRKIKSSKTNKEQLEKYITNGKGFASLMSNVEFKAEEVVESAPVHKKETIAKTSSAPNDNSSGTTTSSSKKNKKKKKKGGK